MIFFFSVQVFIEKRSEFSPLFFLSPDGCSPSLTINHVSDLRE